MSTQVTALAPAAFRHTGDMPAPINGVLADAIAACVRARAAGAALQQSAEHMLRLVREAGRRLSLVQRSDRGRTRRNSSRGVTSYQCAITQAGISRQTANRWRCVADIGDAEFERFITESKLTGGDLTIAEPLRTCWPEGGTARLRRTVILHLSEAEYCAFQQQVRVLGAVCRTGTVTQTP